MNDVLPRKIFLLGLGCQKGGTTWLHDYLKGHPQVSSGFSKEYHALDAHFLESRRLWQDRRIALTRELIDTLDRVPGLRREGRIERLSEDAARYERQKWLAADLDRYAGYFAELAEADPARRVVYDITPSYAVLDAPALMQARRRLEAAGFDVRVVFIMRDPIERAFSAFRMNLSRPERYAAWPVAARLGEAQRSVDSWARLSAARLRQRLASSPEAKARHSPFLQSALNDADGRRSSYERTIRAVDKAFPGDKIGYFFFETLFREEAVRRLTEFAGIEFVPAPYEVNGNPTAVRSMMTDFEIVTLRDAFADTYRFCADRFGAPFIREIWRHY
jgi:sulfotransferase family protein